MPEKHIPINRAKLHRPGLAPDFVLRPALVERLERGISQPLTLVSTAAGYGKSTLLASWLASTNTHHAWLSLDTHDNDLQTFVAHMVSAVRTAHPTALPSTWDMVGAREVAPPEVLAREMSDELEELEEVLVLVLDDYHVIRDEAVHKFIRTLLQLRPPSLHIAMASRIDPPLPLVSLRASGQMTELRQQDLRFSASDTLSFLTKALAQEIDVSVANALSEGMEGWAVGLRLGALSIKGHPDPVALLRRMPMGNQFVTDYLMAEVVGKQLPIVRRYLLATSILDWFCAPLCTALLGTPEEQAESAGIIDGAGFLALAKQANIFLIPLDDEGRWYRYHHLFRELLRHQLQLGSSAEEIRTLHKRASEWLEQNGQFTEAVEQALHGGESLAVDLVTRHRRTLLNQEEYFQISRWLKRFPTETVDRSPELLLLKAWTAEYLQHSEEMFLQAHQAIALLEGATDDASRSLKGQADSVLGYESYMAMDGKAALEHLERALDLLDPEEDAVRAFTIVILAASHQMVGDMVAARTVVRENMRQVVDQPGTFEGRLMTALVVVDWMAGDMNRLEVDAREGCRVGREGALSESLGLSMYYLAVAAYERNDLAEAEKHLVSEMRRLPKGDPWTLNYTGFLLATVQEGLGKSDEARRLAEALTARALQLRLPNHEYLARAFEADLALRQGRLAEALLWADATDLGPVEPPYLWYNPHLTYAKIRLAHGPEGWDELETFLTTLREGYGAIHATRCLAEVMALESLLQKAQGHEKAAIETLVASIRLAEPGACVRLFVDLGPDMRDLLRRLGPASGSLKLTGHILAAFAMASLGVTEAAAGASLTNSDPGRHVLSADLTNREVMILELLAQRLTNKEIAQHLGVSVATVKSHAVNLYSKLAVQGRREAVTKAEALGLLTIQ